MESYSFKDFSRFKIERFFKQDLKRDKRELNYEAAEWKLLDNSKVYNHKVIPILTKEESENLIRWHKSHKHLTSVGSGEDYFGSEKYI